MNNKLLFLCLFLLTACLLLGCSDMSLESDTNSIEDIDSKGKLYLLTTYDDSTDVISVKKLEEYTKEYQNPNAVKQRQLYYGGKSWELNYSFTGTMNYVDFDVDLYSVVGAEDHVYVTFQKDTDKIVRINQLPIGIDLLSLDEKTYAAFVDTTIRAFSEISLDGMVHRDVTTYSMVTEDTYSAGHTKNEFYKAASGEEVTYYTTHYYDMLGDIYTLRHVTIEVSVLGTLFVEIYDIDVSDLAAFLNRQTLHVAADFSAEMSLQMQDKRYDYVSSTVSEITLYSKGGHYYARFYGEMKYKDQGEDRSLLAKYVIRYP